jgi:hypothetical protein
MLLRIKIHVLLKLKQFGINDIFLEECLNKIISANKTVTQCGELMFSFNDTNKEIIYKYLLMNKL